MASRKPKSLPVTRHPPDRGPAPGEDVLVGIAKRVTAATDAPVVGGVAVILHGGGRSTYDVDIYSQDFWATHQLLEAAGIMWDASRREHVLDGIAIHMVGQDLLGGPPSRISTVRGVKVISLADLIRVKLTVGLNVVNRHKDLAHVTDLIGRIPLKKDFAAKLPTKLRAPFKELVEQVHGVRGTPVPPLSPKAYFDKHGSARRRAAI